MIRRNEDWTRLTKEQEPSQSMEGFELVGNWMDSGVMEELYRETSTGELYIYRSWPDSRRWGPGGHVFWRFTPGEGSK